MCFNDDSIKVARPQVEKGLERDCVSLVSPKGKVRDYISKRGKADYKTGVSVKQRQEERRVSGKERGYIKTETENRNGQLGDLSDQSIMYSNL